MRHIGIHRTETMWGSSTIAASEKLVHEGIGGIKIFIRPTGDIGVQQDA
jgi:hypothetical protein